MNSRPIPPLQSDAALSRDAIDALYLAYYDGRAAAAAKQAECGAQALLDVLHARNRDNLGEVAILFEGKAITYERLFRLSEGYAAWLKERGVRAGDHVAIATGSRPECVCLVLALSRLGAAAVLINPQLEGESLQHLLEIANPRLIATSDEAAPRFEGLPRAGTYRDRLFNVSGLDPHISDDDLRSLQRETPSADNRTLCFLSTSGSTGLPKLVPYAGTRLVLSAMAGQNALGIGPRDVMYVCLPLYHANGLMLGVMGALVAGATVLLRSRFSASSFWPDCIAHKVTVFVYVGEVCRFLLRRTSHEASEGHCVRLCIGNGLGSDLWESFQATFRIARIIEFYGGTDASVLLVNLTNTRGSVGYLPEPVRASRKVALLRHDADAGDVVRTTQGRCIEVGPGEAGELVSGVLTESDVKIYQNRRDSEARLLRDVFEPGDCFMRSGDLLSRDAAGFYYFVDRLGDTFRWRGENVSTTEIGALIAAATGVEEACVYGVRVPHEDGRAGMCALVCNASWDPLQFRREIARQAPRFALPMFLRVMRSIPKTTTYKYRRNELARQGFDPSQIRDQLFVMADGEYVPLQSDLFARLGAGEFKW